MKSSDESKSLEQLENDVWLSQEFPTSLIEKCFRYRKIPIKDLSVEQVRLLIEQSIGLDFLVPKAIDILSINIIAEGNFYEGDLLQAVLSIDKAYWSKHPDQKKSVVHLLSLNSNEIREKIFQKELLDNIKAFDKA